MQEIDQHVSDLEKLDLDTLNKMNYVQAIIKETLRLTPAAPSIFYRDVLREHSFGNFSVKPGDLVTVYFPFFHLSEKYFSKPFEFIPERWLPDGPFPDDGWKKEPFAYMPFFAGGRNCIGQHLATIEARLLLITFVKKFRFTFPADYDLKVVHGNF
jgi:cytochrome P450